MAKHKQTQGNETTNLDNGTATATAELPPPADPQPNGQQPVPQPATVGAPKRVRKAPLAPKDETREERFRRLAPRRVNAAIKRIGHVANLANRASYDCTVGQRKAVCAAIITATQRMIDAFEHTKTADDGFALPE